VVHTVNRDGSEAFDFAEFFTWRAQSPPLRQTSPAVHRVLPLSLTFDHRVVTGGEAARFLAAAIDDLTLAT
jgi:2-oxoacid dehydrogenases acyltransferase (catalytic domain)